VWTSQASTVYVVLASFDNTPAPSQVFKTSEAEIKAGGKGRVIFQVSGIYRTMAVV
jgi:hypothetical protein